MNIKSPLQSVLLSGAFAFSSVATSLAEQVIFSEIHYNAKAGLPDFLEITNNTGTPLDMGKWYFSDGIDYTFPDFDSGSPNAHILKHFETILLSPVDEATLRAAYPTIPQETRIFGPYAGALSNSGETLTLNDKNGIVVTTIEYNDGGKWPAAADGTGHSLVRDNPNLTNGGWRNWNASPLPGGTPGIPPIKSEGPPTFTTSIIETTSSWKYDQNTGNVDLGTAWRDPEFDDSGWAEGPGIFGKDGSDIFATPWTTGGRITYYLRKDFQFDSSFSSAAIDIEGHLDDGVIFYLNGQEIVRFNMPEGEVNYLTPSGPSRDWGPLDQIAANVNISEYLVVGENVLAAEVHNRTAGNNDIAFGANVNIVAAEPLSDLIISEIHFGEEGQIDWVELHAPGNSSVSASELRLTSNRSFSNAVDLAGTVPGGGYLSFPITLPIDANGDVDLFLIQGSTVIDAARLDRDNNEETFQSYPVGEEWFGGPGNTRDAANDPVARQTSIIINEIMYDSPSDHGTAEYIELYNRGNEAVDLTGWRISDGVRFDFPNGTSIAPGGYLVVAADQDCLAAAHGNIPMVGNWRGGLSDRGELLRIEDQNGNLVDEVDYLPEGDWPNLADGDGSSMELRHPNMDNNVSTAWVDSDENNKSTMQTFTYTADFESAGWNPVSSGQELHAHLVGDAYVILENISVTLNNSGANLLRSPTDAMSPSNSSSQGWVCQGTHWQSFFDGNQLNLISTGHGDNKVNRAEIDFATPPVANNSYTLSFDARWVHGKSRIIFQTLDHRFGTSFLLPIPENLGTPGSTNSRAEATAAPTVTRLAHSPAVPLPGEAVTVSASVESAGPLDSVELVHRLDNSNGNGAWLRVPMSNDGTGLYTVTVNNFTSKANLTQFYVEANSGGAKTTLPKFGADRPAMWIVDDQNMPTKLLRERFIISEYDRRKLTTSQGGGAAFDYNFPRSSNQFFNATFISNEEEIYYNAEIRKSGSPFTRSDNSNIDHGKWKLPGDRLFRGRRRSVIDASGTPEGSNTPRFYDDRIARYFLYQLGHPVNEMEFTTTVINTLPFKYRESHEPISNDFLNRNFNNGSKGTLLRIDDEWRFNDGGGTDTRRNADWSYKDTDNPTAYQSEWIMRTRESDHDFGNFIEFVRLLDEGKTDKPTLDRVANARMLALNATVRGYDADWDTLTLNRGKNGYFFRPKNGDGWMLLHWDGDRVFQNSGNYPILGNLPGIRTYFLQPHVKQYMNYYMTKLLDEHTKDSARTNAWLDAEVNAVSSTGVTMTKSHYTGWFNVRESVGRSFITSGVANTTFTVTTPTVPTSENTINLAGDLPPTIFQVRAVGQDQASFAWQSNTSWELSGVILKEGVNVLDIEGIDHDGNVVEQTQFTITKNGNAPPVIVLDSSPRSRRIGLDETIFFDTTGTNDPDGDNVSISWSVLPDTGVNFSFNGVSLTADFSQPGFYVFTAEASDGNGNTTTRSTDVSVYLPENFSNFGSPTLGNVWTSFKAPKHSNSADTAHYSLQDHEGRLTINIPTSELPLGLPELDLPPAVNYIDFGSTWKYDDSNQELTGTFAQPTFDDSTWQSGAGFLGFNQIGLPAPGLQTADLRKDKTNNLITYYFRTEFAFTGDPIGARLHIDHIADDGVRYYLNGQVLGSVRLPSGAIDSNTPGTTLLEENVVEEDVLVLDVSGAIVTGTNVFAAEVHNSSAGNADLFFGARVDIAANELASGPPNLDEALHPWVRRPLPAGDWILQTEVTLEKVQFGEFYAGLLVEAIQGENAFRYGIGIEDGDSIATIRVNPSGSSESLTNTPSLDSDTAVIRLERKGDLLTFYLLNDGMLNQVNQINLPAGTTFSTGGLFASTEVEQSLEASFDYAMLIGSDADFSSWMSINGLTDPNAEYGNSGITNLMAYALGRDLNPDVTPALIRNGNVIGFSHRQRIVGGQVSYQVERSTDLVNWESAGDLTPDGQPIENPDGTFTVNLLSNIPTSDREEIYYRLVVNAF